MTRRRVREIATWTVWLGSALLLIALLVGLLSWAVIGTQRASDRRDAQIAALVHTVGRNDRAAAADRRAATRERRTLQRKLDASLASQDALLAYLRAHGIHLPTRLVTVVRSPRIVVHRHRQHHVRHHSGRRTTTSTGPGKSGRHHKHPRHGHRHH